MKLIDRNTYLDKLKNVVGTPDIKVITGVRRSGKSKLLEAFKKYIKSADSDANIIHINFNLTEFEDLLEYHALEKYIEEQQKLLSDLSQVKKQVADLEYMQRAIKTTASITDTARREACFVRLLELANQYDEKYAPLEPTKEQ